MRYFIELFLFGLFSEISAVFINPYSYGSYDPAAENPQTYQYYARYFNPNPHNPYAPYPTHMKPGRFTLPRMYQIDPAYASRYPPNYAETLPYATYPQQQQVDYQRNTPLVNFPQDYEANRSRRPKYPESSEATSSEQTSSEEAEASVEVEAPAPADTERLPLDRISDTNTRAPTKAEKKEKVDDVFSQISEGRTLRAVKRVRHL